MLLIELAIEVAAALSVVPTVPSEVMAFIMLKADWESAMELPIDAMLVDIRDIMSVCMPIMNVSLYSSVSWPGARSVVMPLRAMRTLLERSEVVALAVSV